MPITTVESVKEERESEMGYGSRYYPDRWNPYNRHDTGMYLVYRKSDGKHLGTVVNCKDEWHAKNIAFNKYNCNCEVDLIEE